MFDAISKKLDSVIRKIRGTGIISEANIEEALKAIRMSMLEADVNYKVVKDFVAAVKEKALGESVLNAVSPGQQFTKIVHDELTAFLGEKNNGIDTSRTTTLIMLVGLQGSGKTTTAAKLGLYLKNERKLPRILLVGADTYRPAAKEQLKKLAGMIGADFFTEEHNDAIKICKNAYSLLETKLYDVVVFDTAGRLHIDEDMIKEIEVIKKSIPMNEVFLVADSMLGQESVNVAKSFNEAVGLTGIILTKTDGDARGGAALSMKYVTGVPIKFMGTGEKADRFELFHPDRLASSILGMGDIISLVEKVQKSVTEEEAKKTEEKFRKATFNLEDFLEQMKTMKNMGPLDELLKMIPGAANMGLDNVKIDEKELKHTEAIILSMTPKERRRPEILDDSRKKRVAKGCGLPIERVNKLLKQFNMSKKMMKKMGKKTRHGKPNFGQMPGNFRGF
ncbi:MAG: signal recognition particle protein [Candidatus Goldbacteria bacterium]|nr:signal recognition particle protein [Candidatus Goldiibacteriota bacterium]